MNINAKDIDIYIRYCEYQKKLSQSTIKAYKIDLMHFCLFMEGKNVDRYTIAEYIDSLHDIYKAKSVRRKVASVNAYFKYLEFHDYIEINPMHKVWKNFKSEKLLPKTISSKDLNNIFKALYDELNESKTKKKITYCLRNIAVVELLMSTGIRVSELSKLDRSSIDYERKQIKVYGKGSKERIIQIESDELLKSLYVYDNRLPSERIPFLVNNRTDRLSEQSIREFISRLGRVAEVEEKVTPHMFRHSFATMLLEEDVDIRFIQKILGHSSITTTQIYTHVSSNKQREILRDKNPMSKISAVKKEHSFV